MIEPVTSHSPTAPATGTTAATTGTGGREGVDHAAGSTKGSSESATGEIRVEKAGAGAESWIGKRVCAIPRGAFGGYAEVAVCPVDMAFEMPYPCREPLRKAVEAVTARSAEHP